MSWKLEEDLVAYSVQNIGGGWRWRLHGPAGLVVRQGFETSQARADRAAAQAFWGRTGHRLAA